MPFPLIDRITELDPDGGHVRARKALSLAEEYLQDHFPRFPVMPGVLMLEALFQASAYLVLWKDQFARPLVRMAEARNVKYADFVMPGDLLEIESRWMRELDEDRVLLRAEGRVRDEVAVSGRLVVVRTSNAELDRVAAGQEELLRKDLRRRLKLLWRPDVPAGVSG